jgi:hypothetical protein
MALISQGKQPMSKGKAKAGGPSNKAAAGSSGQGSSRSSAPPARIIGLHNTEEDAVQAAPPLAAGGAQQTEPELAAGGGNTKKDKERLRKERQRQRKMDEAWEALRRAVELMEETAGAKSVDAVEEAMHAAEKHGDRSEPLAALVAVARDLLEQYRAAEAERARVAAEAAAAKAAVEAVAEAAEAAKRQKMEQDLAALTLRMQNDALLAQQMQAQLGVPPAARAPQSDAEETQCVVCFDAPKDHLIVPCGHMCVCEACAEQLTKTRTPMCPVCRGPIRETMKVFCS